ncbi:MAG: divergent PAP2 family protein [bacterium LCO1.1]|uniref:Divergent PAP2 family protein n=1 Tax=Candidatus Weimeria bifida TaxID=2599074 RepID=A0A6N7IW94_9FIRM|nr:divergent PAP2 family protein [Candidatus Weimeria bifida]
MSGFTEFLYELFSNTILLSGVVGWLTAQVIKTIIFAITNHGINWSRLVGDGGMPSGHSATVTAIAVSCGIQDGFDSPVFAVACIMAIIVMHDAMGVRRETGKQSEVLNHLVEVVYSKTLSPEEKLKEFVGHTPLQVFFGFLLGLVIALIMNF